MKGGPPRKPLVITSLPLKKFIEAYEARPVLWNARELHYTRKDKRNATYDELIPFLKELDPNACTRDHVKKKINILRSNYRKELRKIEEAKEAGKFYQPTIWTFHALSFIEGSCDLLDNEPPKKITKIAKKEPLQPPRKIKEPKTEPVDELDYSDEEDEEDNIGFENGPGSPATSSTDSIPAPRTSSPVPLPPCKLKSEFNSSSAENGIPYIAKAWGQTLLNLESRQRVFAEKAISDILFEASLGTLHRDSVKINLDTSSDGLASNVTSPSERKNALLEPNERLQTPHFDHFDSTR